MNKLNKLGISCYRLNTLLPWMAKIRQSEIKKMPKESLFHYCSKSALCVWNMLWHLHFFRLRAFINILLSEVLLGFITSWVPHTCINSMLPKRKICYHKFFGHREKKVSYSKKMSDANLFQEGLGRRQRNVYFPNHTLGYVSQF